MSRPTSVPGSAAQGTSGYSSYTTGVAPGLSGFGRGAANAGSNSSSGAVGGAPGLTPGSGGEGNGFGRGAFSGAASGNGAPNASSNFGGLLNAQQFAAAQAQAQAQAAAAAQQHSLGGNAQKFGSDLYSSTLRNGALGGGNASGAGGGSLNNDDFPALGAPSNASATSGNDGGNASGVREAAEALSNPNSAAASASLANIAAGGANTVGGAGAGEQASAAAALHAQHAAREAHRLNLLGNLSPSVGHAQSANGSANVNGIANPSLGPLNAARGGFGDAERGAWMQAADERAPTPQNYATKPGMGAPPGMASAWPSGGTMSRLEDGSAASQHAQQQHQLQQQQQQRQQQHQQAIQAAVLRSTPVSQVLSSPADRFGLLGLLNIIKMQDPDVQMLSMGTDLQAMGLSLEAPEALYSSLITPLSDNNMAAALQVEPEFHLPSCYNVSPPSPAHHKVDSFSDETLFFIFYSMPRDVMQQIAAAELYQRNWRFHVELQLWLTQNGEPTQKTPTYERGSYVFFDPRTWDKVSKDMVLMYDALEEKPSQAAVLALQSAQPQAAPAQQHSAQAGGQSNLQPPQQQAQTPSLAQR